MKRSGFTLIEVLLAMLLIVMAVFPLIWTLGFANRMTADLYLENLALSLAKEPLEVFRGFGYRWTLAYRDHPSLPEFPLKKAPVVLPPSSPLAHPAEAVFFQREITIEDVSVDGQEGLRVRVEVTPVGQSRAQAFLSRKEGVVMETLIFPKPR